MFFLDSRLSVVGTVLVGLATFGITAVGITALSGETTPSSRAVATPSPAATKSPESVPVIPIGEVPTIENAQYISFPVDSYRPSPADQNLVLRAEYAVMKTCMERYGIGFAAPISSWAVPEVNHDYDRLFGLIDISEAQRFGYHTGEALLPSGEAVAASAPVRDPNDTTPNYLAVAIGEPEVSEVNGLSVPVGGCISEARSELGDDGSAQTLYEDAVNFGLYQSNSDARVVAAFASWSLCMAEAGYMYETPMAAIDAPDWATSTPSQAEINVATADVECKTETNLTGLRVAVATAWQTRFIADHATEFSTMRTEAAWQAERADSILN